MLAQAIISTSRPIALSTISVGRMNVWPPVGRLPERHDAQPLRRVGERPIARQRGPDRVGLRGGARPTLDAGPQVAVRKEQAGAAVGEDVRRRRLRGSRLNAELRRHHHRDEHLDVVADDRAVEGRIGDADDGQRVVVDLDRLADDVRDRRRSRAATARR